MVWCNLRAKVLDDTGDNVILGFVRQRLAQRLDVQECSHTVFLASQRIAASRAVDINVEPLFSSFENRAFEKIRPHHSAGPDISCRKINRRRNSILLQHRPSILVVVQKPVIQRDGDGTLRQRVVTAIRANDLAKADDGMVGRQIGHVRCKDASWDVLPRPIACAEFHIVSMHTVIQQYKIFQGRVSDNRKVASAINWVTSPGRPCPALHESSQNTGLVLTANCPLGACEGRRTGPHCGRYIAPA